MTYINPTRHSTRVNKSDYFADLLQYRDFFISLIGSDISSRFRRSTLGVAWAIIQPLGLALVIAWVWGQVLGADDFMKFAVYVYSGMVVWELFSTTFMTSQDALLSAGGYIKQSRIPLLIFQIRPIFTAIVMNLLGTLGLIGLLLIVQPDAISPLHMVQYPLFLLAAFFLLAPLSCILSILGCKFRDLKHASMVMLNLIFFLSPIFFDRSVLLVPELQILPYVNPLVPLLDIFRSGLTEAGWAHTSSWITIGVMGSITWLVAIILMARNGRKIVFDL